MSNIKIAQFIFLFYSYFSLEFSDKIQSSVYISIASSCSWNPLLSFLSSPIYLNASLQCNVALTLNQTFSFQFVSFIFSMVDQQNTGELWNSKSKSFKIYTKCAISRNASYTITVATSQDEKEEKERIKINIQNIIKKKIIIHESLKLHSNRILIKIPKD